MHDITKKQQEILSILLKKGGLQSSDIHAELAGSDDAFSLVTVKRSLSDMATRGLVAILGSGPSTRYEISAGGRLFANVNAREYCAIEPDDRYGMDSFNFDFFKQVPSRIIAFPELERFLSATLEYEQRTVDVPPAIAKKELERLVIELAWKSSKIEGNTYTLLDTEKLILENTEAAGHSKEEAQMILNHKDAFHFIHAQADQFTNLTVSHIEEVHKILIKDLNVGFGLRKKPVGVTGSKYRPLDNIHQIQDAMSELCAAVGQLPTPYDKALMALVGISYIQPFEDGNKRTSRLIANALLLAHGCAPLSYRSIDENEYREAMLVFYELNAIVPFKKIFIEQYEFAAKNYAVA